MVYRPEARLAIFVEGEFGRGKCKTAEGVLRYGRNPVVAIVDSTSAGRSVEQLVGISYDCPVVASVEEAVELGADALLIGTAMAGGRLPDSWRKPLKTSIESGLDIVAGLHDFLSEDPEFQKLAAEKGTRLVDLRKPPAGKLEVARGAARFVEATTVVTVGSDCSCGKMTASCEVVNSARKKGMAASFVATGQTGMLVEGSGVAIDRLIGDFMAGCVEKMVIEKSRESKLVIVEGQGSLLHPSYSGVTLALMHGACAEYMILCHKPGQVYVDDTDFLLPPLDEVIKVYEQAASLIRPAKVIALALNTSGLNDDDARKAIIECEEVTGLPATDPVRFGGDRLLEAILVRDSQKLEEAGRG